MLLLIILIICQLIGVYSVYVCSDEANNACSTVDLEEWRRPRSESSTGADNDSVYMHSSVCVDHSHRRRTVSLIINSFRLVSNTFLSLSFILFFFVVVVVCCYFRILMLLEFAI